MTIDSPKIKTAVVSPENDPASDLRSRLTARGYVVDLLSPADIPTLDKSPDLFLINAASVDETGHIPGFQAKSTLSGIAVVYFGDPPNKKRLIAITRPPFFYLCRPLDDGDMENILQTALYVADLEKSRQKTEDTLSEKLAVLKTMGETAQITAWEMDAQTLLIKHTGQVPESINHFFDDHPTMESALEYIHPDDLDKVKKALQEALSAGKTFDLDTRVRMTTTDQDRWVRIICHPHQVKDRVVKLLGTFHDITWRKKAEQKLEKEKTLLKAIIDSIPVMITRYDPEANMLYLNQYFEKRVGWTTKDVREIDLLEQVYPDPEYRREALAYMQQATTQWKAFQLRAKNGRVIDSEWSNIKLEGGTQVGIGIDISERKQAEAEKEKLEEQLRQSQKMQAIGTLAGGIAHDFNNLLQAILGHTQIMLLDKGHECHDFANLTAIQNASERAARLVKQLLLFSRKAGTAKKNIDLNQEMEPILKILEGSIPRMIDIVFRPGDALWPINADQVQIEQVMLNLGTNAAESMPSGGRLLIETNNIDFHDEHSENHRELAAGSYVCLTVSDTGFGIQEEIIPHIFDPFFTTKEFGRGSGLGLASVYGIVKNHGGHITCHSQSGQGATFKIYFPALEASPPPQAESNQPPAKPVAKTDSPTILLVDDDEAILDCSSTVLKKYGYAVRLTNSGEEALDLFRQDYSSIDLVILDLSMPGLGGQACLQEMIAINPSARVVIASGSTMDQEINRSLAAGAAGFIGKPYNFEDLLSTVREVLSGSRNT